MCVIVYKPEGVAITKKINQDCFNYNSDGAGYAVLLDTGKIHVKKGFFDANKLYKDLRGLKDYEVVVHYRLATHGIKNSYQCHPFIISEQIPKAKGKVKTAIDSVLFHNGIIPCFGNKKYSDTLEFCTSVLAPVAMKYRPKILESFSGKFALIQNGEIFTYGVDQEYKGLFFSNMHWLGTYKTYNWSEKFQWENDLYLDNIDDDYWWKDDETSRKIDRILSKQVVNKGKKNAKKH